MHEVVGRPKTVVLVQPAALPTPRRRLAPSKLQDMNAAQSGEREEDDDESPRLNGGSPAPNPETGSPRQLLTPSEIDREQKTSCSTLHCVSSP